MRTLFRLHWLYYAAAVAALLFATVSVTSSAPRPERREPQGTINAPDFAAFIAATGIVEPASEVVTVTPDLDGVVRTVFVKAGDRVSAGEPLFDLDSGRALADTQRAEARLGRATAEIALRRAEARAAFARAEAARLGAAQRRTSVERFSPLRGEAISDEEFEKMAAEAEAAAFSWRSALEAARATDASANAAAQEAIVAEAELAEARADQARTLLRAPIDGTVLRVDARAGEAVRAGDPSPPSVAIGDIETLHLRVEIDEAHAAAFSPRAKAEAFVRGSDGEPLMLTLVSTDVMLKRRRGFRDASVEPVDSRVLEVRYAISPAPGVSLYSGQLLDVYVDRKVMKDGEPARVSALVPAATLRP